MQSLMARMFVSRVILQISRAAASAQRVREVLDSEPLVTSPPNVLPVAAAPQGRIAFENIRFGYGGADTGEDAVLRNITFTAEPGQTVVLRGGARGNPDDGERAESGDLCPHDAAPMPPVALIRSSPDHP